MSDEVIVHQKLMSADEVYIYKIPPMKGSTGHRAEDWDLANPLKTCKLLVEVRGEALFMDFILDGKLFCQSRLLIDPDKGLDLQNFLQDAVDTSRYFAVKIQGAGGREATIGFGFRDRDVATDLRESLQHYKKSIMREKEAATQSTKAVHIPKMAEGEKIHINLAAKSSVVKKARDPSKPKSKSVPMLLKKPPPPAGK